MSERVSWLMCAASCAQAKPKALTDAQFVEAINDALLRVAGADSADGSGADWVDEPQEGAATLPAIEGLLAGGAVSAPGRLTRA